MFTISTLFDEYSGSFTITMVELLQYIGLLVIFVGILIVMLSLLYDKKIGVMRSKEKKDLIKAPKRITVSIMFMIAGFLTIVFAIVYGGIYVLFFY
ncbi:MAG: hypothetical protein ACTSQE_14610 [Candidatus Heimdallarchaeaceae archaeon]